MMSISDYAMAEFLGLAGVNWGYSGEQTALGSTAIYRAVALIAGSIATLPLKTYETTSDGIRTQVPSFLDEPQGPYAISCFTWKEMVLIHLLLHNETYLLHVYNAGGALIGLWPINPLMINRVVWDGASKDYTIQVPGSPDNHYDPTTMTQILGLTSDGLRGFSVISTFRRTINTTLSGEIAANRQFNNGFLVGGLVTSSDDMDETEAKQIKDGLKLSMAGPQNAGDIAVINRNLTFSPWTMNSADAQFIESRGFQVEEVARMFGIPPHLLAATEKQTSWGTGIQEQNNGLSKYTLMPWTSRIEESLSALLPNNQHAEFDYSGFLQGTPADEINLLIAQINAGLITKDEARAIRNLPPLPPEPAPVAPAPVLPPPVEPTNNGGTPA